MMKATTATTGRGTFEKVSDVHCLYRFSTNGVYYGLVRHKGKLVRKSLQTDEKAVAKRKLQDFQRDLGKVDPSSGRLTLRELCARYLATVKNQSAATMRRKNDIVTRLLADFPNGADAQVSKVKKLRHRNMAGRICPDKTAAQKTIWLRLT